MGQAIRKHLGDFAAIVALIAVAIGVAAYILANQEARPTFPLIEESPTKIEAEFSDAQAVVPGQGQSVRIAGVEVGKIRGVELEDGLAVVEMDIDPEYSDMVREDATALLRPRTGLKDMFVELDPGSDDAPALEEGDRISVENTAPDIDPDEILSALDTDTRAYLKLLIGGAGKGLDGNGEDLREVFKRFEPLHRDLARVQGAFADRRQALSRLIHNYGILTQELGRNDDSLVRLVTASNDVFEALASENDSISRAVALLPGTLRQTESTLRKVDSLGGVLGPTLDDLRPAFRQLDVANREVLPLVRNHTSTVRDEIRPFIRQARPFVRDLKPTARNLAQSLPDLTTAFGELNRLFNMFAFNPAGASQANRPNPVVGNSGDENPGGETVESDQRDEGYLYWLAWLANNGVSLHSTSDAEGPVRRGSFSINCSTATVLLEALFIGQLGPAGQGFLDGLLASGPEELVSTIQAVPPLGTVLAPIIAAISDACPQIFETSGEGEGEGGGGLLGGEEGAGAQQGPGGGSETQGEGLDGEAEPSGGATQDASTGNDGADEGATR